MNKQSEFSLIRNACRWAFPSAADRAMCYMEDAHCEGTIVLLLILAQLLNQPALEA